MIESISVMQDSMHAVQDTLSTFCDTWEPQGIHETFEKLDKCGRLVFEESKILQVVLGFIMFGVALGIKGEHFKNLTKNPKLVLIGFTSQFLLLPALTFLLVLGLNKVITPTVALGMILVAACPGGNISNFMSSVAKGNVALSVTLTALATLGALFLTPLNFTLWGSLYLKFAPPEYVEFLRELHINPVSMFKTVFIILGLPLALGMTFNHYFPKVTKKIFNPLKNFSMVVFMALVVVMFLKNKQYFVEYIGVIFIIVLIHNILALGTGYSLGSIFKTDTPTRRTLAIETGIQNSGLGLVLLFDPKIFPPEMMEYGAGMAFIAGWWGIWHIISGLSIANFWAPIPYGEKFKLSYYRLKKKKQG